MAPYGLRITLGGAGEPLMNNEVYDMVRYAADRGLRVLQFTNALLLDEANMKKLIKSGLWCLNMSIGALNEEDYSVIRDKGDYEKVITNLRRLIDTRNDLGQRFPLIRLQTEAVKYNVGDDGTDMTKINDFIREAKEFGADIVSIQAFGINPFAGEEWRQWQVDNLFAPGPFARYYTEDCPDGSKKLIYKRIGKCPAVPRGCIWVTCDGDICCCQHDIYADHVFGNILEDDLMDVWRSEKFRKYREGPMARRELDPLCDFCGDTTKCSGRLVYLT